MKAAVFHRPGTSLVIEDVATDKPGPHEVPIGTAAAGVCHSYLHFVNPALAWSNFAPLRALAPALAEIPIEALIGDPLIVDALQAKLRAQGGSASQRVARLMFVAEPPSSDAYEIADKAMSTRPPRAPHSI